MSQLKTDNTFRNRFLFLCLLMTIFNGLTAFAATGRLDDGSVKTAYEHRNVSIQTENRLLVVSLQAKAGQRHKEVAFRPQAAHRPHFDLNPSHFFLHLPISLMEDLPEDLTEDQIAFIFRAHEPRHKRRFLISVSQQQYSFTTRLQQLQLLLLQYMPGDENKTGIYQWHDAFLPAYYKFLFRYTLF